MSTPRKLGVAFCLLGFLAVCVLALTLNTSGGFAGLPGIEADLESQALAILDDDAPGARVIAEGRELTVALPGVVNAGYDADRLADALHGIDGVRSVRLTGEPTIAASPDDLPDAEPTVPPADPTPEPTEAPADPTPEPTPEPTAAPAEPTAEPTVEATPEPTPAPPTLEEVVAGIDLSAVSFAPGTSRFTAQDTAVLDGVADELQGMSGGPVQVQAHTDNVGDPDVNLLLSQQRAEAVVTYLIDRGVDPALLTPRGFGAQVPIADNSTEQGRAANQRVVLVVEGN